MHVKGTTIEPDYAVPPGDTLAEALRELSMDQTELANRTGLSRKTINEILSGKAPLTADTANKLELATGIPARIWNNLERVYRERLAKIREVKMLKQDVDWVRDFPYAELAKRGLVKATRNRVERLKEVLRLFGVASPKAWSNVWQGAPQAVFRRSTAFVGKAHVTATWLRLVQLAARDIESRPYSKSAFRAAVKEMREWTTHSPEEFAPAMVGRAATAGVAVVFVPEFLGAAINGAAMWESSERPIVAVNLRGKWNDIFWFTFFHECGHVLLHARKKQVFIDQRTTTVNQVEQEANAFAADLLVPSSYADTIEGLKSKREVKALAEELGLHPGIVVGQYQFRTNNWGRWNGCHQ